VYGAGVSYTNRYECPRYCSVFAAVGGPEESRAALDLWTADVAVGYEARLSSRFFLRGIGRFGIPVRMSDLRTRDYGDGHGSVSVEAHGNFFLLRLSVYLTVGYAFELTR
jgi:hypothetical protein